MLPGTRLLPPLQLSRQVVQILFCIDDFNVKGTVILSKKLAEKSCIGRTALVGQEYSASEKLNYLQ